MAEALLDSVAAEPGTRLAAAAAEMATRLRRAVAALGDAEALAGMLPAVGGRSLVGRSHARDPVDRLAGALTLAPVELDLMLLAALPEEDERWGMVLRALHPRGEAAPTPALAARVLCCDDAERRALRRVLETGRAVRAGVLVCDLGPWPERGIRLADALWGALLGIDVWPDGLEPDRRPVHAAGLEDWLEREDARRAAGALAAGERVVVLVRGADTAAALGRGAALAERAGVAHVRLELGGDARLVSLHAVARGAVPVLGVPPRDEAQPGRPQPPLPDHPGPLVACAGPGAVVLPPDRPLVPVAADRLEARERRRLWHETLPELADRAALLASRHPLEPAVAAMVAADVRAAHRLDGSPPTEHDVARSVRARAGVVLQASIELVRPRAGWGDLVLSQDKLDQLHEAVARLRHQAEVLDDWGLLAGRAGARGVRLLFAGPPGTGKTLAAEVLAGALGVDLLAVDSSRVVSKWIGETEKNLAAVFDAAERTQAVLLFDEADALFGRRTEVSDSHDRYANLETAYLLMRLERFEGLAVLSTNLRQNIDPAFTRRLEFVVAFGEPTTPEREAIWRRHLPATAPLAADVEPHELAALFPAVGGLIRNAAVAAAFLAAADGGVITRDHVVRSLRREYEKSGRAFPGHRAS
jgi:hypothetical protein